MVFQVNAFGQLRVLSNGSVGIGTNNPGAEKLGVLGNASIWSSNGHQLLLGSNYIGSNYGKVYFYYPGIGDNDIHVRNISWGSDENIKINISSLTNGLSTIKQLQGVKYQYRQMIDSITYGNEPDTSGFHFGFIAQDVNNVLPQLVSEANGHLGVNYIGIIPFLVEAINEQQITIDSLNIVDSTLDARISSLETVVANCCSGQRIGRPADGTNEEINSQTIELSNVKTIILDQNVPNPFAEQTTITYFIPSDIKLAEMIFYDNSGRVLRTVDNLQPGNGEIKVYAPNLSSGIYSYSILLDGKLIQTKKMVCSK